LSGDPIDEPSTNRRIEEGRLLGRYLIGREVPQELLARYADAVERLPLRPGSESDAALLRFVRRHPWSLPWLDAGAGVARRDSALRGRLLLMLALLETSVDFADRFLPRPRSRASAVARVSALAGLGAVKILGGLVLWPLATRIR